MAMTPPQDEDRNLASLFGDGNSAAFCHNPCAISKSVSTVPPGVKESQIPEQNTELCSGTKEEKKTLDKQTGLSESRV